VREGKGASRRKRDGTIGLNVGVGASVVDRFNSPLQKEKEAERVR
jgi:hypothetical protein